MVQITTGFALADAPTIKVQCPSCRHAGVFYAMGTKDVGWNIVEKVAGNRVEVGYSVGIRRCPNAECNSVLFVVLRKDRPVQTFPPVSIDFDSTSLPAPILASFEEAIKCHSAGCFKAAALMVRRVLEELCKDKGAKGKTLKERLSALSKTIILPVDLLAAADELRLLGNDAAHVEAKDYDELGTEEVEIAIELTKELLKAVYQYTSLVARLQALKATATSD